MAVQKVVAEKWKKITGKPLVEAYGLTETSPGATINPLNIAEYNGSIGLPLPSTDLVLRDDEGHDVALGERGEICIKGPQVMAGYWNCPEETKKVIDKNGWLATGDIGIMDERGFVRIVDRKKDMILVLGIQRVSERSRGGGRDASWRARMRRDRGPGCQVGRGGEVICRKEGPGAVDRVLDRALSRLSHRATSVRAKSSFAASCRSPTWARYCVVNCAMKRDDRWHEARRLAFRPAVLREQVCAAR